MKIFSLFFVLLLLMPLVGCQTAPTKMTESRQVPIETLIANAKKPIVLTANTVIIDARRPFDYALAHLPDSVNLTWDHFTQRKGPSKGLLVDESEIARRLALYGVTPEKPVVVVGYGRQGQGEAGRMAWMLYYLGVNDVQMADINYFKTRVSNIQENGIKNAPAWDADPRGRVLAQLGEVKYAISYPQELKQKTVLIDVRSKEEYFARKGFEGGYASPDLRAIHIDWREFFDSTGRPQLSMRDRLKAIKIRPNDRVILVSRQGVRSGAVTMALLSMGFSNAANYAGGLSELLKD